MWYKAAATFILSALATLGGQGCSNPLAYSYKYPAPLKPAIVMHGTVDFTPGERAIVEESAKIWREQTNGQANIRIQWDLTPGSTEAYTIVKKDVSDPEVVESDCEATQAVFPGAPVCLPAVLAWVSVAGGIHNPDGQPVSLNVIPERYTSKEMAISVVIHEMGHVLGLPHQQAAQAVMYPSQNAVKTCLRPSDLASFCQHNVCDSRPVFPCE